MHTTPVSLLEQLRGPGAHGPWERFVLLYYPLIYDWARRAGASPEDSADLVQDVLTVLIRRMPEFQYDSSRTFRGWLHVVTLNAWRRQKRRERRLPIAEADLGELGAEADPPGHAFEEDEYRRFLARRALQVMKTDFQPATWRACWENVVEGRPAADVARELGITVNAVYLAKSRILRRLHIELDGLLD
ncbi:MAG: sigma-70 family RNA polymerase sigma factor [Isosphaeraceae bacterium]